MEPTCNPRTPGTRPPPSTKEEILQHMLTGIQEYNARMAREELPYRGTDSFSFDLEIPLQLHSEEAPLPCRETPEEFAPINVHFSAQIRALFAAIHDFEQLSTSAPGGQGEDYIRATGLAATIRVGRQSFDRYKSCLHRHFHHRLLTLSDGLEDSLPELPRVTSLRLFPAKDYQRPDYSLIDARPVSPRVPLQLATRLPNLRRVELPWLLWERLPVRWAQRELRHYTRPWAGPWRDARREFRAAVDDLHARLPEGVISMRLWCWQSDARSCDNQTRRMPDLTGGSEEDPVSAALRTLAARLEELDARAVLTPDLFRPPVAWPRMRRLKVEFHPWSPDGTWYFAGPRGEDPFGAEGGFAVGEEHYPPAVASAEDEEMDESWPEVEGCVEEERAWDQFRTVPKRDKIEPLLLAFAAALQGMPALEEAELFAHLSWQPSEERLFEHQSANGEAGVSYNEETPHFKWRVKYVPGADGEKGLLTWQVGDWRPHERVSQAFEAVGGKDGIQVEWKSFEFTEFREKDGYEAFL
ncbi:hypothetical protein RB595_008035 [Gaeumannomyces hyphopodioides]